MKITNKDREKGKRIFQDIIISISQRKRQKVIRIQIKRKDKNRATIVMIKKFTGIKNRKKIQVIKKQEYSKTAYSDKKIKAKYAPEYSVLNPETSSDSASLKSNGAR